MKTYTTRLHDGTLLSLRPIRPDDKELLAQGFHRLSPESRYARFFRSLEELSPDQLRYLTEVDHVDHSACVAVTAEEPVEGVGVVRWIRLEDAPNEAEVAVTVVDDWQRRGIGRTLLVLAALDARAKGIDFFRAWILGRNLATIDMLRTLDAQEKHWESGVLDVLIPLEGVSLDLAPLELKPR